MARRARSASGALSEAGFQAQVIGLARVYSWRIYHAPDNRPAGRTGRPQQLAAPEAVGFPDLILLRGPELIIAELKTARGRLGPGQPEWLAAWATFAGTVNGLSTAAAGAAGQRGRELVGVYLWRADNADDWEQIQRVLGRGHERRRDLDPMHNPCS